MVAQLPGDSAAPDRFSQELIELRVDRRSRFKKATQLLTDDRLSEAANALQKLVEEFPDMDMAWRILGRTQLQMGNLAVAEHSLKTALRIHPDSVEGQYYLGLVMLTRKKHEAAKSYFLRAIELKPDHALSHYKLSPLNPFKLPFAVSPSWLRPIATWVSSSPKPAKSKKPENTFARPLSWTRRTRKPQKFWRS